jgi:hypothetical protein
VKDFELPDFSYVTKNISNNPSLRPDVSYTNVHKCYCESSVCSIGSFNCCVRGDGLFYSQGKLIVPEGVENEDLIICECNDLCSCNVTACSNRIVQNGIKEDLEVICEEQGKSWGVRTKRGIKQGKFVCEIVGELITSTEAKIRLEMMKGEKLFQLYSSAEGRFQVIIDPSRFGNVSRFLGQSKEPNLIVVKVFVEHLDSRFPRAALFARRDINAGELLTFDFKSS